MTQESPVTASRFQTQWSVLTLDEQIALEKKSFDDPCVACGEHLETEGDFARHFVIPNLRFPNLGWCPKVKTDLEIQEACKIWF